MKKACEVKIGDVPYIYSGSKFVEMSPVAEIKKPNGTSTSYGFYLSGDGSDCIYMSPNSFYKEDYFRTTDRRFYIFPDSKDEIVFLNSLLSSHKESVRYEIRNGLYDLLGIE